MTYGDKEINKEIEDTKGSFFTRLFYFWNYWGG